MGIASWIKDRKDEKKAYLESIPEKVCISDITEVIEELNDKVSAIRSRIIRNIINHNVQDTITTIKGSVLTATSYCETKEQVEDIYKSSFRSLKSISREIDKLITREEKLYAKKEHKRKKLHI